MKEISFDTFYQLYQKGSLSVLDVGEVAEFQQMHIESALNFPLSILPEIYEKLDKNQTYYVICKSGIRSAHACQFLAEKGDDVVNVATGMDAFE